MSPFDWFKTGLLVASVFCNAHDLFSLIISSLCLDYDEIYRKSRQLKRQKEMQEQKKRRKNPTLALILSAIFPGLGQIYNNQLSKGIILLLLNTIINFLMFEPLQRILEAGGEIPDRPTLIIVAGYTIAGLILWLYAIIDAKKTADRINEDGEMRNY